MILLDKMLGYVILSIFLVLIIASIIAQLINKFKRNNNNATVIDNLIARINAWWIMCIIITLSIIFGMTGMLILFGFISFHALREYITLIPTQRSDEYVIVLAFFVVIPLQYIFIYLDWYTMYIIFIPVYVFLFFATLMALTGNIKNYLTRISEIQWSLFITIFCISHIPAILLLKIPNYSFSYYNNFNLIIFLIIVVQLSDVLQYVFGKLFGKKPIVPKLSPNKTVEGFLGGVLTSALIGCSLSIITPFTYLQSFIISLIINIAGFCGSLCMSAVKRDVQIKDFGTLIKGHGGMMDRIDSLCFSAPIFSI